MHSARSIWIVETLISLALMAVIFSQLSSDEAGSFIAAELVVFMVSFFLALRVGPGKVLVLGVGLAFALATLLAATAGGCSDSDILCFDPGAMFVIGLIVAGALYPGWALGTGLGTLARMASIAERSNR
jgi:integral membrane sensor domain MASE1